MAKKNSYFSDLLEINVSKKAPSNTRCEVVGVAKKGSKDFSLHDGFKDYQNSVKEVLDLKEFSLGSSVSTCFTRLSSTRGAKHTLFVGLGEEKKNAYDELGAIERTRRIGATIASKLISEKVKDAAIYLDSFLVRESQLSSDKAELAYAFAEGFALASYRFDNYFTSKSQSKDVFKLTLVAEDNDSVSHFENGLEKAYAHVVGTTLCRDLGNEPSNILYPETYAKRIQALGKKHGFKVTVLDEKALAREGMGLLLGVGKGSEKPPRLVLMEYTPKKSKKGAKSIAFVGKGVTFDSGGISIKPSSRMEDMKHDMCGSSAVVGAMVATCLLGLETKVFGVVALAENMPSGSATNPGNILTSRSGKTVEISNTDAEGRLILADALDYIQDKKPDYIIDLATLTGAVTVTLGKSCAGLMGNDPEFNEIVKASAKETGERVWELPLFEEYFDDLKSEYADMRNSGDSPSHGTAKGAMFMKQFIRDGVRWVHLDIAAMAYGISNIPYYPKKSSTGYGVRLLLDLAQRINS